MRLAPREQRQTLNAALMAAYDDRDKAAEIPDEVRQTVTETGQTIAEVWADSADEMRERLIQPFGRFVVLANTRGKPIGERLSWDGLSPELVRLNGAAVALGLQATGAGLSTTLEPAANTD